MTPEQGVPSGAGAMAREFGDPMGPPMAGADVTDPAEAGPGLFSRALSVPVGTVGS
ncbi:hypothetical protein OHT57_42485 [Streptomyces sp. NBC_00285]|uniref:hypothetical protein n=1 Tax=Streptomyces sp. NBC_00285 TaxID=2975700 RepID=UPI002E2B61B9|nr:hypothetical protein [Streptomyces sp. NBC_00285]